MSHSTETFCRGPLRCFRKFRVSKNFMHYRGISRFSVRNFLSDSTKKIVVQPFSASENFGYRKMLCIRGEYHDFQLEFFCLTVPKNFRNATLLCCRKFRVSKNFKHKRGYCDFLSQISCLTVPKNFVGELLCISEKF